METIGFLVFMLLSGVFFSLVFDGVIVPLKEGDPSFTIDPLFVVWFIVFSLLSCWMIIRFRTAIRRWKGCVVIDGALHTIDLYGTHAPLVQVSFVEHGLTARFPFPRLLLKMGSADYVLLDDRYDWYDEVEWTTIGSSLATFLGVSYERKIEDITRT